MKKMLLAVFFLTLGIVFTSNAYSQGVRVKASNNNELQRALNDPNVSSIEITQEGYYEAITTYATANALVAKNGTRGTNACTYQITKENICFAGNPTSNSATANATGTGCVTQPTSGATLGWSSPQDGTTLSFTMANQWMYAATFDVTQPGIYEITYRWDTENFATYQVYVYANPDITLTSDAENCETASIGQSITWGTPAGTGDQTEVWEVASGAGAFIPMVTPTTNPFTFDPGTYFPVTQTCGEYTIQVTATNPGPDAGMPGCSTVSSTTFYIYDTPSSLSISASTTECLSTVSSTLIGDYSVDCTDGSMPTLLWTVSPATGTLAGETTSTAYFTPDPGACGSYTFYFSVDNGLCSSSVSHTIYYYDTPVVDITGDESVCGLSVDLTGTSTQSCTNGEELTLAWSKVSGPGAVTFTPDDGSTTAATVTMCGEYVFAFEATNGDCTASSTHTVIFTDVPVIDEYAGPTAVCGDETQFSLGYSVNCGDDPYGEWTVTPTGDATVTAVGPVGDMWDVLRTGACGTYTFTYTVFNGVSCSATTSFDIDFYDEPVLTVTGKEDPFTCSTVTYTVANSACEVTGQEMEYTWIVAGGTPAFTVTSTSTLDVTWTYEDGAGSVTVTGTIVDVDACEGTDVLNVTKKLPTLEGQVKYWNASETYMPTPFPTNINGSFPEDYFYVELWGYGVVKNGSDVQLGDTYRVEPNLRVDPITGDDNTLMSYFGFTLPTNTQMVCSTYSIKIYDGGLTYSTNQPLDNTYLGASYTYTNWGGVNATDAYAIQLMVGATNDLNGSPWNYTWVGPNTLPTPYGFYSENIADVNTSTTITALDALTANYRAVGLLGSYPNTGANLFSPNFAVAGRLVHELPEITWSEYFDEGVAKSLIHDDIEFTHSGADYQYFDLAVNHKYSSDYIYDAWDSNYINVYYEAEGDINASYIPTSGGFKAESAMDLVYENEVGVHVDQIITIPISVDNDADVNAISLFFNFRNDLIEVLGTNFGEDYVFINNEEGILNIGWFSNDTREFEANEIIAQIKVRVLADMPSDTELFELAANTELADVTATPISDITLKTIGVTTSKLQNTSEIVSSNYPNPFDNATTIAYTLPESGKVKITVLNSMGITVTTLVEEVQEAGAQNYVYNADLKAGVYFYSITLQGETNTYSTVKRMIVVN